MSTTVKWPTNAQLASKGRLLGLIAPGLMDSLLTWCQGALGCRQTGVRIKVGTVTTVQNKGDWEHQPQNRSKYWYFCILLINFISVLQYFDEAVAFSKISFFTREATADPGIGKHHQLPSSQAWLLISPLGDVQVCCHGSYLHQNMTVARLSPPKLICMSELHLKISEPQPSCAC